MHLPRRTVLTTLLSSALAAPLLAATRDETPAPAPAPEPEPEPEPEPTAVAAALAALERRNGGRLGVWALDLLRARSVGHRGAERFGMCSTFKLPLAALVLRAADAGQLRLDQTLRYGADDMVPHAPVTSTHLDLGEMRIEALAQAAQETSDNVAANLLLRHFGGPAAVTAQWRELGDEQTRLDRFEPDMNLVPPGEERDTTTPEAMARLLARIFDGHTLTAPSAALLQRWMIDTRTGLTRLRGGFPKDWTAGDKTGTGIAPAMANKHNDVAVVWRDQQPVLVVTAYYEADGHYDEMRAADNAVLAEVGRQVAAWWLAAA